MSREYLFPLPYNVGTGAMLYLQAQLIHYGAYDRIPADLRARIEAGDTVVTKEDLDRIDEALWGWIAMQAGLQWRNVPGSQP